MGVGDFVRGLWGWRFGFWPCGGPVGMALFTGWGTCKKNIIISQVFRLGGCFRGFFTGMGIGVRIFAGLSLFCWFLAGFQVSK